LRIPTSNGSWKKTTEEANVFVAAVVQLAAAADEDARSAEEDPSGEFYAELEEMKKVGVCMGSHICLVWLANHLSCPVLFYTENMRVDGSIRISR
jgi:hypothetical protein